MMRVAILFNAGLALAACSSSAAPSEQDHEERSAARSKAQVTGSSTGISTSNSGTSSATASATAGGAARVKESTRSYEFEYSWPAPAGRYPALVHWLEADRTKLRKDTVQGAKADPDAIARGLRYSGAAEWKVVTETPRFLSLSEEGYTFTGGAHGMPFYDALLWDKQANRRMKPLDVFTSKVGLDRLIRQPFCAALDKQRAEKRGEPVKRDSGDEFDKCIAPLDETVLLGSTNGRAFNRIGIIVAPYEAGPYAEGGYEVTLPVTPAIIATVKPEYRAAFAPR